MSFGRGMGKASSLGLGLALGRPERRVWVLDGDGSLVMNLGSLVTIAQQAPANLLHVLLENGVYEVTGGQPVPGAGLADFATMARAAGYRSAYRFDTLAALEASLDEVLAAPRPDVRDAGRRAGGCGATQSLPADAPRAGRAPRPPRRCLAGGAGGMMAGNKLYYGDNLAILREYVPDESVGLIYLDPPFNSNRNYNIIFKDESGQSSDAQIVAFEDTWHWGPSAESAYGYLTNTAQHGGRVADNVSTLLDSLVSGLGKNQMTAYLVEMSMRLIELHRVLKPTGSMYLHCDPSASHYLKILMDAILGPENFRNRDRLEADQRPFRLQTLGAGPRYYPVLHENKPLRMEHGALGLLGGVHPKVLPLLGRERAFPCWRLDRRRNKERRIRATVARGQSDGRRQTLGCSEQSTRGALRERVCRLERPTEA